VIRDMFPQEMIERMAKTGVVAGFSIEDISHAVPLVKALQAGGIEVIELTLRTDLGIEATRRIALEVEGVLLGVGTILTPEQAMAVKEAGADFGVSPGMNPEVVLAAKQAGLPFAPGVATPSDIEGAVELGCRFVKLFPVEPLGGLTYLKSMAASYKHLGIQYFPLGGIHAGNMQPYLEQSNVPAVGGSWIVKKELVDNEDWDGITASARRAIEAKQ